MLLITWGICLGGEATHLNLRYLINGEHVCFKVQQQSELRGRDHPGANRGGGVGTSHAVLKGGSFPVSELIWNQRGVNGEEGGQRDDAVLRGAEEMTGLLCQLCCRGLCRKRGRLLGWWEGYPGFCPLFFVAHFSGHFAKDHSFSGRKVNKNTPPRRGADSEIQSPLSPIYCNSSSWGLSALGLKSHVTPGGLWN